jgi:CRISPR system Cascade subunit CasD
MTRHLLLRIEAPLIAFGGETIDSLGITRDFPASSMIVGLIANALGWRREDAALHDRLQQRLIFSIRIEREPIRMADFQTAQLSKDDRGWTTRGVPEERQGGASTYSSPHLRHRDFLCDACLLVALRLEPADESPMLDDVANAFNRPSRPLFIGRKPCLPSQRLFAGWQDAPSSLNAIQHAPTITGSVKPARMRAQWPARDGIVQGDHEIMLCDERNWLSGVHGGWRPVRQGLIDIGGTP